MKLPTNELTKGERRANSVLMPTHPDNNEEISIKAQRSEYLQKRRPSVGLGKNPKCS